MNKYKKFIKDAYNGKLENLTMCQDWKRKIEREFPELLKTKNQELEIGKWHKDSEGLHFIESIEDGIAYGYGFCSGKFDTYQLKNGSRCLRNVYWMKQKRTLPTEQEIKEALIKEAEKRGFKEGVTIKNNGINKGISFKFKPINGEFEFYASSNILDSNGQGHIFDNGKWAEIIQNTITKAEAEKQLNAKIID